MLLNQMDSVELFFSTATQKTNRTCWNNSCKMASANNSSLDPVLLDIRQLYIRTSLFWHAAIDVHLPSVKRPLYFSMQRTWYIQIPF